MKIRKSIAIRFSEGVGALKEALEMVPDGAKMDGLTEWRGYGPNESRGLVGIQISWEENR